MISTEVLRTNPVFLQEHLQHQGRCDNTAARCFLSIISTLEKSDYILWHSCLRIKTDDEDDRPDVKMHPIVNQMSRSTDGARHQQNLILRTSKRWSKSQNWAAKRCTMSATRSSRCFTGTIFSHRAALVDLLVPNPAFCGDDAENKRDWRRIEIVEDDAVIIH